MLDSDREIDIGTSRGEALVCWEIKKSILMLLTYNTSYNGRSLCYILVYNHSNPWRVRVVAWHEIAGSVKAAKS